MHRCVWRYMRTPYSLIYKSKVERAPSRKEWKIRGMINDWPLRQNNHKCTHIKGFTTITFGHKENRMSNPLSSKAQLLWTRHVGTINKRSLGTLRAELASNCSSNNIRETVLSLPKDIDCAYLFLRRCDPTRAIASSFMRFLDHIQTHHSR